jgi:tetratricopeptide (TPR) repeat protein
MRFYPILRSISYLLLFVVQMLYAQDNNRINLAKSLEKSYRYQEALDIYNTLYQQYPGSISVINGMINCYKKLQAYDALITFLQQHIGTNTSANMIPMQIELGEAYFLNNEQDTAFAVWNKIIEHRRFDVSVYRIIGAKLVQLRAYPQAIILYQKALNTIPKQEILHLEIANLYQATMEYGLATRHYLYYYHSNAKIKGHIERQILRMSSKTDDSTPVTSAINHYLEKNPDKVEIREMLAGVYLKQKQYDDAFANFKMLENEHSQGLYYLRFAQEACGNSAWHIGIEAYENLLQAYPASPLRDQVRFELAKSYAALAVHNRQEMDQDYMQKALAIFQALSKKTNSPYGKNSLIQLGDIYRNYYDDLDKAIVYYQDFLQLKTGGEQSDKVKLILGDTYVMKGEFVSAARMYRSIYYQGIVHEAIFKLAELDFYSANFAQSLKQYNEIIGKAGVASDLANNALDRQLFISTYREDSLALSRYARAELLLYQHKWQEAAQLFYALAQQNTKICHKSGLEAGRLYMNHQDYDKARSVFLFVMEKDSTTTGLYSDEIAFLYARNEEQAGNVRPALDLYQNFLLRYPDSIYVHAARQYARKLNERLKNEQI